MISFLIAALAAQAAPVSDEAQLKQCLEIVKSDAARAVNVAADWRIKGGGFVARQCAGYALVELERWQEAASAFDEAAREAETARDPRRADYLVQAGNAWLAADEPVKARGALDAALATGLLGLELQGEVHFDRARAAVALNEIGKARSDVDAGLKLVPADPFGWYLSSALALKEGRLARAQDDIAEALRLAPEDPELLFHAGNVAGISGELDAALGLYSKAIRVAPQSPAAKKARAALAANMPEAAPAQPR